MLLKIRSIAIPNDQCKVAFSIATLQIATPCHVRTQNKREFWDKKFVNRGFARGWPVKYIEYRNAKSRRTLWVVGRYDNNRLVSLASLRQARYEFRSLLFHGCPSVFFGKQRIRHVHASQRVIFCIKRCSDMCYLWSLNDRFAVVLLEWFRFPRPKKTFISYLWLRI